MVVEQVSQGPSERQRVIALLRARAPELRSLGIRRLALFGSVARGEAGPRSDVDLLVELAPDTTLGFKVVSLRADLDRLLGRPVGLAFAGRLDPEMRARIGPDLVPVF